jgi:hypothetical protein
MLVLDGLMKVEFVSRVVCMGHLSRFKGVERVNHLLPEDYFKQRNSEIRQAQKAKYRMFSLICGT